MDQAGCTVLVVDDEPTVVDLVGIVLQTAGMHILKAHSGIEALALMEANPIDVVLSDISMPGMTGFELLERIKVTDESISVVLMTAYDCYEMLRESFNAGAYDYLEKPLSSEERLILAISRAYDNVKLIRENNQLVSSLRTSNLRLVAANERLKQLNTRLRKLAITDSLTRLYNRRYIDDWIRNYTVSKVNNGTSLSVILIDVDHFKKVNDTLGHESGDDVLRHLSKILAEFGRETDLVGRYGGEEFVVAMPDTPADSAFIAAERLRRLIAENPAQLASSVVNVTVSIGLATTYAGNAGLNQDAVEGSFVSGRGLLAHADRALYTAKDRGRNNCVHHDELPDDIIPFKRVANE